MRSLFAETHLVQVLDYVVLAEDTIPSSIHLLILNFELVVTVIELNDSVSIFSAVFINCFQIRLHHQELQLQRFVLIAPGVDFRIQFLFLQLLGHLRPHFLAVFEGLVLSQALQLFL